jgi:hypothetical protein
MRTAVGFLALFFIACAPVTAKDVSQIRAMMQKAGLTGQFAELDQQLYEQFLAAASQQNVLATADSTALADIVRTAFEPEQFLSEIEQILAETLSTNQLRVIIEFYDSELGQRVLNAELAAAGEEEQAKMMADSAALLADLKNQPERLAVFQRIDDNLQTSEIATTVGLALGHAIAIGVAESQLQGGPEFRKKLINQISGMREPLKKAVRDQIMIGFAYTYRNIPDDDLTAYADFLGTEAVISTYAAVAAGMHKTFTARGHQIGTEFALYIKQKKI